MNVHTPERQRNESRADYRQRRRMSRAINALNGKPVGWMPETRRWGSFVTSPPLEALLTGSPLPKLKKRKSRKIKQ